MPGRLEVSLLGPVEIRLDGDVVPLASTAQRAVLAGLSVVPGHPVPASELIDALWGEAPPSNAPGNLHSHISRLRRVVGADRITRDAAGYRLGIARTDVDVGRVEDLVREARASAATDPAHAATLLTEALAMWRGEPLADLAEKLLFAPLLARLGEWRRTLQEECFDLRLDVGEAESTLPLVAEAIAADPLRERLTLVLMRALHQVGRTPDALAAADTFRRRVAEESGLDPSPALEVLQRRILDDDPTLRPTARPWSAPSTERTTLPAAPADRFVGRQRELDLVRDGLQGHRVVSVVGPGGIGKTRLALEILHRKHDSTPVHLVELAGIAPSVELAPAVAAALGLRAGHGGPLGALADLLGPAPTLLVLDNCEHLRADVGILVTRLQQHRPQLRVLATSRQRLGLPGELVIRVSALSEPEQVELFCDRASLLRPEFDDSARPRALAAEICHLVDGLPLAVELAAHREAVFGLAQLRDRLSAGLDVLDPVRGADRSTALLATVEWSYRLLDPAAQALFDRLSVCVGGFPLSAVDHLAPPNLSSSPAALLSELVEASLVVTDLGAAPPRYRLLEVMRRVGHRHLAPDELDRACADHARWAGTHVAKVFDRMRGGTAEDRIGPEAANVHEALTWLVDSGRSAEAAELALMLGFVVTHEPHLALCTLLRRLAPAEPPSTADECRAAMAAGTAACLQGDHTTAEPLLTTALECLPAEHPQRWIGHFGRIMNAVFVGDAASVEFDARTLVGDPQAPATASAAGICAAVLTHLFRGDRAVAEQWAADHRELLDAARDQEGFVSYTRGELAAGPDPITALTHFERARLVCRAHGHSYHEEVAAIGRAAVLIRLGHHTRAVTACLELITELRRVGMWPQTWTVLRLTAELLVDLDDPEPAAVLLRAGEIEPAAPPVLGADRERHARLWDRIRGQLDAGRLAAAEHEGTGLGGHVAAAERGRRALLAHLPVAGKRRASGSQAHPSTVEA